MERSKALEGGRVGGEGRREGGRGEGEIPTWQCTGCQ